MPKIYLSPSTQEYNPYVTGAGSEEYFMNLLADAMEPILLLNGIQFSRNTPDMTAASSISHGIESINPVIKNSPCGSENATYGINSAQMVSVSPSVLYIL